MRVLDIGHGPGRIAEDVVNLSATRLLDTDVVAVWGNEQLPFPDASFDLVHSSHCLEHVPWYRAVAALSECRRLLAEGGTLEIWVPDFAHIVQCYLDRVCGDGWRCHNREGGFMQWINGRLFAYGRENEQNFHRAAFDREYLEQCFRSAGFAEPYRLEVPRCRTHPFELQLGVGAAKNSKEKAE
jgi:predicted SAM-dependent methyltransferase